MDTMKIKIAVLLNGEAKEKEVSVDEAIAFLKNQLDAMEELAELLGKMDHNVLKSLFQKLMPDPNAFKFEFDNTVESGGIVQPNDVTISPPWDQSGQTGSLPGITFTSNCDGIIDKPYNIN